MNLRKIFFPVALLAVLVMAGCGGDDDLTTPGTQEMDGTGVVRGEIKAGDVAFEFASAVDWDRPDPRPGPFLIRGRNVAYDDTLGVLTVDLTVVNASERTYPEPVSLTFVQLVPEGVTVENSDNGETGPGASIDCEFENDDAMWTPREESLPRTVHFGVDPGVSIGFVARIDVGMLPMGGTIGGLVWHDLNEDGVIDAGEEGLERFAIRLEAGPDRHWMTMTGADGAYRFDDLAAGYYTVIRLPRDDARATTPAHLQVILVEENGEISDFLAADFGVLLHDEPQGGIEVGDCVHVKGDYVADPDRLVASHLCACGNDDDDEDEDKDAQCWDRIAGPVTAINLERHALAVMGTWILVRDKAELDLEDVEIGQRVRAQVETVGTPEEHHLEACSLKNFEGNYDRVRGIVQAVRRDEEGRIIGIRVLDTPIAVRGVMDCEDD